MTDTGAPSPQAGTVPRCYRHPDRETYISCQRCGKPICPDCMRQASVGFQCPDCVREANAGLRQTRTTFGGRVSSGPAIITYALIAINVGLFIAARADGPTGTLVSRLALFTSIDFPRSDLQGVAQGSYWQLITSAFLHVEIWHIALNMMALYFIGPFLEQQLGRWRYLSVYLVSAFAGGTLIYLLTDPYLPGQPISYSLGASGAIFGLFGCELLVLLKQGRDVNQLLFFLAINLFATFTIPHISWQGHIGGLVAGLTMGAGIAYAPRERRTLVSLGVIGGTAVLCLALVVMRTISLT